MHKRRTQDWTPGSVVKVGFLTFVVLEKIPTPGDYRPDMYLLESLTGQRYHFTPHYGLEKL